MVIESSNRIFQTVEENEPRPMQVFQINRHGQPAPRDIFHRLLNVYCVISISLISGQIMPKLATSWYHMSFNFTAFFEKL